MRIIGDYDIDGVTATYILLKGFKRLGAKVDTYIPDRIADGYGIHNHLIEKAKEDGVDTILTCDNGFRLQIRLHFQKMGMTVVVTDHHEVPRRRAKQASSGRCNYQSKQSDCTYQIKISWRSYAINWFLLPKMESRSEKEDYLEPAAIATVGEYGPSGRKPYSCKGGLLRLPHTKNKGLKALIRAIGLENQKISSYDIGFRLGPCINASGRLDTAMRSLSLLQCEDEEEAAKLANDLKALNDSRKALTEQGYRSCLQADNGSDLKNDRVMVVFLPDCHESLAGIIAGRIRENITSLHLFLQEGKNR